MEIKKELIDRKNEARVFMRGQGVEGLFSNYLNIAQSILSKARISDFF